MKTCPDRCRPPTEGGAAYLLIATEWVHCTAVALGGAGLMLLLHVTASDAAFFSRAPGTGSLRSSAWTGT